MLQACVAAGAGPLLGARPGGVLCCHGTAHAGEVGLDAPCLLAELLEACTKFAGVQWGCCDHIHALCACLSPFSLQGKLQEAVEHYRAAAALWRGQTVVLYSLANALLELGQLVDARDVLQQAVQQDEGTPRSPFKSALQALRKRLDAAEKRRAGA